MLTLRASYELTSSTQVVAKSCIFGGLLVLTDGTNAATVNVYDVADSGDAAAATKIWECVVAGNANCESFLLPYVVRCRAGIYVTLAGSNASFIVYYN